MQTGDPSLAAVAAAAAAAQSGATPNGPGMLLTQQYAPHQQAAMPPVSLPPIGQAINQSNLAINQNMAINQSNMAAAAAAAQIVAAAAASGQYTQPVANGAVAYPGTQQPLQFDAQGSSTFGPGGTLPQQQLGNLYQPSRRASSFTNLALLQQQQPSSFGRAEFRSQAIPKAHEQPESQYPSTALLGNTSMLSTFQPPQQARNQQIFGAHVPSLAPVSNRYSTSTGAYGTSALNAAGTRPQSYSGTRPHGNMSSMSRISLANKVRHDVAAAFGGTKPGSQTQLNATSAAYLGSGLLPASSAAIGREGDASDFVPGTCVRKQNAASEAMRDRLLQTAHQMYSGNARSPVLIEMLLCLHELHPRHLPTLLLLACAYFSSSQPAKSLEYNKLILKIDPNYVEA
ncbi:hypothetical protein IW137_004995, partial [Coemansia sp. RSA 1287]